MVLNGQKRSYSFRRYLCSNLTEIGYHVFALDFRGYGDSEGEPSEQGFVTDVIKLYELIRENSNSRIFLYGHSLGCG